MSVDHASRLRSTGLPDRRPSALGKVAGLALAVFGLVGCSSEASTPAGEQPGTVAAELSCGDDTCAEDEFCVATQGALCMPLPQPGESCVEGCVLTEHCCNCTAFACLRAPSECEGPSCKCLDNGFLDRGCPPERRECSVSPAGVEVLCVSVAYDEDPFGDAG